MTSTFFIKEKKKNMFSFKFFNEISRFLGEIKTDYVTVLNSEIKTSGFSMF